MLSLLKYCSTKQANQIIYRSCSKYISNTKFNSGNGRKNNNIRSVSTQTLLKPTRAAFPAEDRDVFIKFMPTIIRDLTEDEVYSDIPEVSKRFSDLLKYHLPYGSHSLGLLTLLSYKALEKPENLTTNNIELATALAWCTELLTYSLVLFDDLMDNSETRRNSPCWFRLDGIGMTAINDALYLQNSAYAIVKKYLSTHPNYAKIMETFQDAYLKIIYGQCLDNQKPKLEEITMDRFDTAALYKLSYPAIEFVRLGMHLTNTYDAKGEQIIKFIFLEAGRYMTIENDMFDCYGDVKITGKIGTDIQEGKSTWLAATALQKASPLQRKLMEDHYGKANTESVQIIRNLYDELDIPGEYAAYRKRTRETIFRQLKEISSDNPMHNLACKILSVSFSRLSE